MTAQTSIEVLEPHQQQVATVSSVTPMEMLDRAITQGAGLEVVERLMGLQERWEKNNARKAFDQAISDAKSKIPPIMKNASVGYKNKDGSFTGYNHETLDEIARVVDPILSAHGLSYRFRSQQGNGGLSVTCVVAHRDGYYEETTLSGPPDQSGKKNAYQAVGSAATYLQRYTLKLALGLSASKDDDAQQLTGIEEQNQQTRANNTNQQQRQQNNQAQGSKGPSKDTEARSVFMLHQESIRQATSRDGLREAWRKACADKDRLPADWQADLAREKDAKVNEIIQAENKQAQSDEFPFDQNEQPIEAEQFLKTLEFEMSNAADLDALDEVWYARNPMDALDFPNDQRRAQEIYDRNRQRLGRP